MNKTIILVASLIIPAISFSENIEKTISFVEPYISPISKSTNEITVNSNEQTKDILKGKNIAIPKGWRLVNVIGKNSGDYTLFFQSSKGDIYSIGLDNNGSITGNDNFHITTE